MGAERRIRPIEREGLGIVLPELQDARVELDTDDLPVGVSGRDRDRHGGGSDEQRVCGRRGDAGSRRLVWRLDGDRHGQ